MANKKSASPKKPFLDPEKVIKPKTVVSKYENGGMVREGKVANTNKAKTKKTK